MHKRAAVLRAHAVGRRAAHVKRAVQMHRDHRVPVILGHLVKNAVTQNAGVVDHAIDAAKIIQRALDDAFSGSPGGYRISIGHCGAARSLDLIHHFLRRTRAVRTQLTTQPRADVIDHHLRASGSHRQRHLAPDAAACAGDYHYFVLNHVAHACFSNSF